MSTTTDGSVFGSARYNIGTVQCVAFNVSASKVGGVVSGRMSAYGNFKPFLGAYIAAFTETATSASLESKQFRCDLGDGLPTKVKMFMEIVKGEQTLVAYHAVNDDSASPHFGDVVFESPAQALEWGSITIL